MAQEHAQHHSKIFQNGGISTFLTDLQSVFDTTLLNQFGALPKSRISELILSQRHLRHGRIHANFKFFAWKRPETDSLLNRLRDPIIALFNALKRNLGRDIPGANIQQGIRLPQHKTGRNPAIARMSQFPLFSHVQKNFNTSLTNFFNTLPFHENVWQETKVTTKGAWIKARAQTSAASALEILCTPVPQCALVLKAADYS